MFVFPPALEEIEKLPGLVLVIRYFQKPEEIARLTRLYTVFFLLAGCVPEERKGKALCV